MFAVLLGVTFVRVAACTTVGCVVFDVLAAWIVLGCATGDTGCAVGRAGCTAFTTAEFPALASQGAVCELCAAFCFLRCHREETALIALVAFETAFDAVPLPCARDPAVPQGLDSAPEIEFDAPPSPAALNVGEEAAIPLRSPS